MSFCRCFVFDSVILARSKSYRKMVMKMIYKQTLMRIHVLAVLSASVLIIAGCTTTPEHAKPTYDSDGWISLANGHDLDDWIDVGSAEWTTRMISEGDGEVPVIYGWNTQEKSNSYLINKQLFDDFDYVVDIRLPPGANSGIDFRIPEGVRSRFSHEGYEAQVCDSDRGYPTGSIYNITAAPFDLHKVGDWNEIRVRCEGNRIQTWVNGQPACDITNDRSLRGHFVMQVHGDPHDRYAIVEVKNPRVRPLK